MVHAWPIKAMKIQSRTSAVKTKKSFHLDMKLEGCKTRATGDQLIIPGYPPPESDAYNREETKRKRKVKSAWPL